MGKGKIKQMISSYIRAIKSLKTALISSCDHTNFIQFGQYSSIGIPAQIVKGLISIDDNVIIQDHFNFISFKGKLTIKKYSVIASGCTIIPDSHKVTIGIPFFINAKEHINDEIGKVIINEDCWIGANVTILSNCEIGRGAIVGAGSVVTKNIPPYAVVVGAPARIIASKFTEKNIMEHERHLYPKDKRLETGILKKLFDQYYVGLRSLDETGEVNIDTKKIKDILNRYSIIDYYKQ